MEKDIIEKKPRKRVVIYLDPDVLRRLKILRGQTDKPVGHIIEEALARDFDAAIPAAPK